MANVLDIRRRIRSVRNTRQITKAMQMVSAAKLRRAQERALAARPMAQMLTSVLKSMVARAEVYDPLTGEAMHPLLTRREEKTALLVVVTGEKGLAGAFNSNILKAATKFLAENPEKDIDILCVGRKGRDFFRRRYPAAPETGRAGKVQIVGEHVGVLNRVKFEVARQVTDELVARYTDGRCDAVFVLYNEFKSVIAQRLVVDEVLPIEEIGAQDIRMAVGMTEEEKKAAIEAARKAGASLRPLDTSEVDEKAAGFASQVDYLYEQPPKRIFDMLLPRYVSLQMFRAMLESEAAEHAARMTAMDSATNNATDMIDSLTLIMNRIRQAKITKEIIEIVSGAAAL